MKVRVQHCWCGGDRVVWHLYARGTVKTCGRIDTRFSAWGEDNTQWTRGVATQALDFLESVYGIPRGVIRFEHR